MVLEKSDNLVCTMLSDTILALCRNTLAYEGEVCVEGLIGITVDQKEVFLVHLNETIQREGFSTKKFVKAKRGIDNSGNEDNPSSVDTESEITESTPSAKRRRKHRRRSRDKEKSTSDEEDGSGARIVDSQVGDSVSDSDLPVEDSQHSQGDKASSPPCIKTEGSNAEDELIFVKEEPSNTDYGQYTVGGISQPDNTSHMYTLEEQVHLGQLQELAFQSSGDMSQPNQNIPSSSSVVPSSQPCSSSEHGTADSEKAYANQAEGDQAAQYLIAQKMAEKHAAYWKSLSASQDKDNLTAGQLSAKDSMVLLRQVVPQAMADNTDRQFTCDMCSKSYTSVTGLKRHVRMTHTGDRPYKCDVCGMGFSQSTDLKRHFRIHTGEKPYKCNVCGKAFTQSGTLTVHMRTHIVLS